VKGGIGSSAGQEGEVIVGVLAAVNALGEIVDGDGSVIAGSRSPDRPDESAAASGQPGNTTLVVVATNATLTKERAHLLAQAAHEGISAAVRPAHTIWDGDTVFTLATGRVGADQRTVEALAVTATSEAIRRAVLAADGVPGFPSAREVRS
jgi:L-aminopeptidase/D-esterase-like protein